MCAYVPEASVLHLLPSERVLADMPHQKECDSHLLQEAVLLHRDGGVSPPKHECMCVAKIAAAAAATAISGSSSSKSSDGMIWILCNFSTFSTRCKEALEYKAKIPVKCGHRKTPSLKNLSQTDSCPVFNKDPCQG